MDWSEGQMLVSRIMLAAKITLWVKQNGNLFSPSMNDGFGTEAR